MRLIHVSLITILAGCGAASPKPAPAHRLGATDHLLEAQRHDADADVQDQLAEQSAARSQVPYLCGDRVLADQLSSGGERLAGAPCWSAESAAASRHLAEANRLRGEAAEHRHRAAELLAAERASCSGLTADDLEHTPFAHREDVAAVSAEVEGGALRGARIRFRPVEGLDAGWLRQAVVCHRARAAALGWDATYMSHDPSTLADVEVTVTDDPQGVLVVIRSNDPLAAEVAYRRAEDLLDPTPVGSP